MLHSFWLKKAFLGGLLALVASIATMPNSQAAIFFARMDGPSESPPNVSPGTGTVLVSINEVANTMRVQATFTGLTGNTTAAHIHGATAVPNTGVAGVMTTTPSFVGFPLGVTSGSMDQTYDLTAAGTYNATFVTAQGGVANARAAMLASIANSTAYFNIHTSTFGGGEIRGFLSAVPEPSSMALVGSILLGAAGRTWQKRRKAKVGTPS